MEIVLYLYDAGGNDRQIGLDEVNIAQLDKRQLLWGKILSRDQAVIQQVFTALQLEAPPPEKLFSSTKRPQLEVFAQFFCFSVVSIAAPEQEQFERIPIDFVVGENFVLTIQDGEVDYLEEFQARGRGQTTIGELDAISFTATLLDQHIVSYFRALEKIEEKVDELDDRVLKRDLNTDEFLSEVVRLHRSVSNLRRWFWPHREVFYALLRPDFRPIAESDSTEQFRLLKEHFENAFSAIEASRNTVISLFDLYATKSAQTTNDLVQRLTFITMIVGVLGVVAGTFGMNFEADSLFKLRYGFWFSIAGMILLAIALTLWARRKRWI